MLKVGIDLGKHSLDVGATKQGHLSKATLGPPPSSVLLRGSVLILRIPLSFSQGVSRSEGDFASLTATEGVWGSSLLISYTRFDEQQTAA